MEIPICIWDCPSKKYILIREYFNTQPVTINYRRFQDKLFKRDFAKEIQKKYKL